MNIKVIAKNAPTYRDGSSRAKWYAAVKRYNNKSVDAFIEAMGKKPPTLTKSGQAEPPRGWVNYFVREKAIELVE